MIHTRGKFIGHFTKAEIFLEIILSDQWIALISIQMYNASFNHTVPVPFYNLTERENIKSK